MSDNNDSDGLSSVSTHGSMPSLMSDDESDTDEDYSTGSHSDDSAQQRLIINAPDNNNNNNNNNNDNNLAPNDMENDVENESDGMSSVSTHSSMPPIMDGDSDNAAVDDNNVNSSDHDDEPPNNNNNNWGGGPFLVVNEHEEEEEEEEEEENQQQEHKVDLNEFWNNFSMNNENIDDSLNLIRNALNYYHNNNANDESNNIDTAQRQRDEELKRLTTTLFSIIDEVNNLCWTNYDNNSDMSMTDISDNKNDDIDMKNEHEEKCDIANKSYGYSVYDKQCNLLNPSYNLTPPRANMHKQEQITFKLPDCYPLISVIQENDCILYETEQDEKDNTPLNVAEWKMNLLAIDPISKLIFIASRNHIYIYKLALTAQSAKLNYKSPYHVITNIDTAINRLLYAAVDGEPVVYAVDYAGYINIIYCKHVKTGMVKLSNIIPDKADNSIWSIGAGKTHNRIIVGSNTHIVQVHDASTDSKFQTLQLLGHRSNVPCVAFHPYNENKAASVSIDGTVRVWDIADRYNIKQKKIEFDEVAMDDGVWMWSVCWINAPCLYLDGSTVDYMVALRNNVFNFYKERQIWNGEIEELNKSLYRTYFSNTTKAFTIRSVDRMVDIVKAVSKRFDCLIDLSNLCGGMKRKLSGDFELRFNALLQELVALKDGCTEKEVDEGSGMDDEDSSSGQLSADDDVAQQMNNNDMSSVSTHNSMPALHSDDDGDDIEIDAVADGIVPNVHQQISQAIMELEGFNACPQSIDLLQTTPPAAQQGFRQVINYQNNNNDIDDHDTVAVIGYDDIDDIDGIDDVMHEKEEEHNNDSLLFDIVSYNDDGNDNIECHVNKLRIEKEKKPLQDIKMDNDDDSDLDAVQIPYQHSDVIKFIAVDLEKEINELNILFLTNLSHFKAIGSCLNIMEHGMKLNCEIVRGDKSPFIDLNFETQTIKLSNQLSEIRHKFIVLCKDLIYNQCMDDLQENINQEMQLQADILHEMLIKLQNLYKLYISSSELYVLWMKEWDEIEKRKKNIKEKNELEKNKNKSIANKDYLIACSQSNIYLINTQNMKIIDFIDNIMNNVLHGYERQHRLEYIEYINELCLLIVSSNACNRVAFIRICNKYESESEPKMIVEAFYPKTEEIYNDNLGCILGLQSVKCGHNMWRLYVLYQISDHQPNQSAVPVKLVSFFLTNEKIINEMSNSHNCHFMQCIM